MFLQSFMTVCASSTESNASTESTSSRTREPNDSTNGFCQGEPGSMKLRPAPPRRHQSRSGVRGHLGAVVHPHELGGGAALADDLVEHPDGVVGVDRARDPDRQAPRGCARRRRAAASASGRRRSCRTGSPAPRRGWAARPAAARPGRSSSPSRCRLRLRCGTRRPSSRHSRWIFLRFTAQPSSRTAAPGEPVAPARMLRRELAAAAPAARRRARRRVAAGGAGSSGAAR